MNTIATPSSQLLTPNSQHTYYLGLGTNIGEVEKNLEVAIEKISLIPDTIIKKISNFYTTKAYGYTEQDDFLNGAIEVKSIHSPEVFFCHLQNIEKEMGRQKNFKNGPRIIDIDILFCGSMVINTEQLIIPHPEIEQREFVLKPMMDIAPDFVHPVLNKSIKEIYTPHP